MNFSNNNKISLLFPFPLSFFPEQLHGQILTETTQVHILFPKVSKIPLFSQPISLPNMKNNLLKY